MHTPNPNFAHENPHKVKDKPISIDCLPVRRAVATLYRGDRLTGFGIVSSSQCDNPFFQFFTKLRKIWGSKVWSNFTMSKSFRKVASRWGNPQKQFTSTNSWLVLWNIWISFPFSWECHHPNWLIFFRGVGLNHQPETVHPIHWLPGGDTKSPPLVVR